MWVLPTPEGPSSAAFSARSTNRRSAREPRRRGWRAPGAALWARRWRSRSRSPRASRWWASLPRGRPSRARAPAGRRPRRAPPPRGGRREEVAERALPGDGGLGRGRPRPTARLQPQLGAKLGAELGAELGDAGARAARSRARSGMGERLVDRQRMLQAGDGAPRRPLIQQLARPVARRRGWARAARPAPRPWCRAPARWPPPAANGPQPTSRSQRPPAARAHGGIGPGRRPPRRPAPGGWRRARETARPQGADEPLHLALGPGPVGLAHAARSLRAARSPRRGGSGAGLPHRRSARAPPCAWCRGAPRAARRRAPRTRARGSG